METVKNDTEHFVMKDLLYKGQPPYCFTYSAESIIADPWISVFFHMQFLNEQ